jgi:hypothetical protein
LITTTDLLAAPRFERVTILTPLGIRFWDAARDAQVSDGLHVSARPLGQPSATPVAAFVTASGIYAFQGLPGLQALERPPAGSPGPVFPGPAGTRQFWIDVVDPERRFVSVTFKASAPTQGLLLQNGTPPVPSGFFLFSSPSRSVGAGMAAVRADLVDATTGAPAAFAVVEVQVPGPRLVVGLADDQGRALVMFPFPTVVRQASPPPAPIPSWPLTVSSRYSPASLTLVPTAPLTHLLPTGPPRPELGSMLAQASAKILAVSGGASVPTLAVTLTADAALILKTQNRSELLIQSA